MESLRNCFAFLQFSILILCSSSFSLSRNHFKSCQAGSAPRLCCVTARNDDDDDRLETNENTKTTNQAHPIGFYVHIPYCQQRCRYCNFAIVPIGSSKRESQGENDTSDRRLAGFEAMDQTYRKALVDEINSLRNHNSTNDTIAQLGSIYFGGGTPSLAPLETIRAVMSAIQQHFSFDPNTIEITMEMDPGTFDRMQLEGLQELGVNRVSLGVQSLNDTILDSLGRIHTLQDVSSSVELLHDVYGDDLNYSVDLITGLPGQTTADWIDTLHRVTSRWQVPPKHLSVYDLQIEAGTSFGTWYDDGERTVIRPSNNKALPLPSEDEAAFMYQYTSGYLRHKGWEHYEVSSYAFCGDTTDSKKAGLQQGGVPLPTRNHRSRHNQIYWGEESEWYAVGLGATSWINRQQIARPRAMTDYIQWVDQNIKAQQSFSSVAAVTDKDEMLLNLILKRLRTSEGLDLQWLANNYGLEVQEGVLQGASLGLELGLASLSECGRYLSLVDSKGFLYSNSIISSIFAELDG